MLEGAPSLPGSVRAIAHYRLRSGARLFDLDDPGKLRGLGLRPSDVVSRDYLRTRKWARRIYKQGGWAGVSWWSFYNPGWTSVGVWDATRLALEEVRALRLEDAALVEASRAIARRIVGVGGHRT